MDCRYSISDKVSEEIRYFADFFGKEPLYYVSMVQIHGDRIQETLRELIQRFGALLVFTIIEGILPSKIRR
jgi:hypothetical protein